MERRTRGAVAAVIAIALILAGCGSDKKSSSTSGSQTAPAQATASLANLQLAASDVVRETSYKDKAGAKRAYDAFAQLFNSSRSTIHAKAPQEEKEIVADSANVGKAIGRGDLAEASREAKALQTHVNAAAATVSGQKAGPKQGLLAVLEQMKAAARDLKEEAKNKDAAGTKHAYQAFGNLFKSSRKQLQAKKADAVKKIQQELAKLQKALKGKDNPAQIEAATGKLQDAVDALEAKTK